MASKHWNEAFKFSAKIQDLKRQVFSTHTVRLFEIADVYIRF